MRDEGDSDEKNKKLLKKKKLLKRKRLLATSAACVCRWK
jgi:hypothetical protein